MRLVLPFPIICCISFILIFEINQFQVLLQSDVVAQLEERRELSLSGERWSLIFDLVVWSLIFVVCCVAVDLCSL